MTLKNKTPLSMEQMNQIAAGRRHIHRKGRGGSESILKPILKEVVNFVKKHADDIIDLLPSKDKDINPYPKFPKFPHTPNFISPNSDII